MKAADETLCPSHREPARACPETDAAASQWVVRQRAGLDSASERELAVWVAADPTHAEAFSRLSAMAEIFQRARAKGATSSIVTQLKIRARKRRGRQLSWRRN